MPGNAARASSWGFVGFLALSLDALLDLRINDNFSIHQSDWIQCFLLKALAQKHYLTLTIPWLSHSSTQWSWPGLLDNPGKRSNIKHSNANAFISVRNTNILNANAFPFFSGFYLVSVCWDDWSSNQCSIPKLLHLQEQNGWGAARMLIKNSCTTCRVTWNFPTSWC